MPREPYIHNYQPTPATIIAAKEASEIQDAVNMRAIVASMLRRMDEMREEKTEHYPHGINGDLLQNHPVIIAYLDKLCSLARCQGAYTDGWGRVLECHTACRKLKDGEVAEGWTVYPL